MREVRWTYHGGHTVALRDLTEQQAFRLLRMMERAFFQLERLEMYHMSAKGETRAEAAWSRRATPAPEYTGEW